MALLTARSLRNVGDVVRKATRRMSALSPPSVSTAGKRVMRRKIVQNQRSVVGVVKKDTRSPNVPNLKFAIDVEPRVTW